MNLKQLRVVQGALDIRVKIKTLFLNKKSVYRAFLNFYNNVTKIIFKIRHNVTYSVNTILIELTDILKILI